MSAMLQPIPNHRSETFGWGQIQFFDCEAGSPSTPRRVVQTAN